MVRIQRIEERKFGVGALPLTNLVLEQGWIGGARNKQRNRVRSRTWLDFLEDGEELRQSPRWLPHSCPGENWRRRLGSN
jgi:hypothetical protein